MTIALNTQTSFDFDRQLPKKLNFVDLFSGAGGLTLGLINAGLNPLLSVDNDHVAVETLLHNSSSISHPVRQMDVRELLGGHLLNLLGMQQRELDLLVGGPPCQGFSIQRIGEDSDDRNDLVDVFASLISETLPKVFVMENVPGLAGSRGKQMLSLFLSKVNAAGYTVKSEILNAGDYGVPQRRNRLFVIGWLSEYVSEEFKFPVASVGDPVTVRQVIGDLPTPPDDYSDYSGLRGHRKDRLSALNIKRLRSLKPGQGREHLPVELLADCHKISSDKIGHRNVYGRMSWDKVAPTITARFDSFTRGQFGHPSQDRTISLYEGALLQTFPPMYEFTGTKVQMARQIGNAIPPKLAESIGRSIVDVVLK